MPITRSTKISRSVLVDAWQQEVLAVFAEHFNQTESEVLRQALTLGFSRIYAIAESSGQDIAVDKSVLANTYKLGVAWVERYGS